MKAIPFDRPVIAISGLAFEARLAEGPGVQTVFGQDKALLMRQLETFANAGIRGIISFGTAGGLTPSFLPGTIVVASSVISGDRRYQACPDWTRKLLKSLPSARHADLVGVPAPILTVSDKAALRDATGAGVVDMESHLVAEAADRFGIRFAVLRVVIDPAHRPIPAIALVGMRPDGKTDAAAVIKAVGKEPAQLKALLRLAQDARAARRSLLRSRKALGPFFGLLDARELALDMK